MAMPLDILIDRVADFDPTISEENPLVLFRL
jgi:hypothetical protein